MVGLCFKFWAGILKIVIAISVASKQYDGLEGLNLIQILMWQIEHFLAPPHFPPSAKFNFGATLLLQKLTLAP